MIKEVVPPQLAPSGVLGLIGLLAPARPGVARKSVERVGSWGRFRELYGSATALAMPEAQQALQNGVFELVVVEVDATTATAAKARVQYDAADWLVFTARTPGTAPNGLQLVFAAQSFEGTIQGYELRVRRGTEDVEIHRNLSPFPGAPRWIGSVLAANDSIIGIDKPTWTVTDYAAGATLSADTHHTEVVKVGTGPELLDVLKVVMKAPVVGPLQFKTTTGTFRLVRNPGGPGEVVLLELAANSPELAQRIADVCATLPDVDVVFDLPAVTSTIEIGKLTDKGVDAAVAAYVDALEQLVDVQDVDLVVASVQDLTNQRAAQIYGAVISHCELMSADAKGRLGFGQVPKANDVETNVDLVGSLISDRFALFAPYGVLGAAVGRIGSLPYFYSPTFKTLAGLGQLEPQLRVEAQRTYLKANIVPVAELPGRGNVIVRGLTTDGDQINVRRVADRAVRGVKQIGELFIGKLNTEDGRNALKQKLNEFLLQMAAESAIVPSTDGSDPAFKLDVYSTQADFALGIVRVDMAIRPVRAIDYIYATVLVQV
ncbi:phage tail sheath protein [Nannocystaceae bacterium ST9]